MSSSDDQFRSALAAFQGGQRDLAAQRANQLCESDPTHAGAHYLRGVLSLESGALDEAQAALERALALAPDNKRFHVTLGNLHLERGDDEAAVSCFREALTVAPDFAPVHHNLGTALKRLGRLDEAFTAFRQSVRLLRGSRWCGPAGTADPTQSHTFNVASRAKLEHDLEQYRYLLDRKRLPESFATEIAAYESVLQTFGGEDQPAVARALGATERAQLGQSFNRLIFSPLDDEWEGPVLSERFDGAEVEAQYFGADPSVAVIDDFLSDAALQSLRRFCLEATIWFDCKDPGGYCGAYLNDGFDSPVLLDLDAALRERLPRLLGPHRFAQAWAFKYRPGAPGTRKHVDQAAVNLNFWITPDDACTDPSASGIRIHPVAAPPDWDFDRYNRDVRELEDYVAASGKAPIDIPYRCNRCVIFDSSLIHESMPLAFRSGYENRRINVTVLYGERAERPARS